MERNVMKNKEVYRVTKGKDIIVKYNYAVEDGHRIRLSLSSRYKRSAADRSLQGPYKDILR